MAVSLLAEWANFYVITGAAAAGLTGLTFVVIALAANSNRVMTAGLRAYVTPTIVHFGTALGLAAFLNVPRLTAINLSVGFGVGGLGGLVYGAFIVAAMRGNSSYVAVREDWLWHAILPTAAYGALLAISLLVQRWMEACLYGVAAVSMLLLSVGIHNAWDVAVSISVRSPEKPP